MQKVYIISERYTNNKLTIKKDRDIINLHYAGNNFQFRFNMNSYEDVLRMLYDMSNHEEWDEDCEEYYQPDEIQTLDFYYEHDNNYYIDDVYGNFVVTSLLDGIIDCLRDFMDNEIGICKYKDDDGYIDIEKLKSLPISSLERIHDKEVKKNV